MNTNPNLRSQEGHQLLQAGALLFILGLLVGFAVPLFANPRVALSSHLEGVMNGTVLLVLGLVWPRLRLDRTARRTGFWLVLYGTYANWLTTLAAAAIGAGGSMMPIAAQAFVGTEAQEGLIAFGLISLSVAMVIVFALLVWGLRGGAEANGPNGHATLPPDTSAQEAEHPPSPSMMGR